MDIQRKDLFFYSNYCEYCKNLLAMLIKKGIRDQFLLINVDKKELKIPPFIDRVPSILTVKKDLFTDDAVLHYIETKTQQVQQVQEDLMPFMFGNALNSSQYTFITGDGNGYDSSINLRSDMIHRNDFGFLGQDQAISAPADREADNKSNKLDSSALERLIDMRKMEDNQLKTMMEGNRAM